MPDDTISPTKELANCIFPFPSNSISWAPYELALQHRLLDLDSPLATDAAIDERSGAAADRYGAESIVQAVAMRCV
jgi:hypothetical protein